MDTEQAQITIEADVEYTLGNRTEIETKVYEPFNADLPKLTNPDMYKFMMYKTTLPYYQPRPLPMLEPELLNTTPNISRITRLAR